jgi:hypothetical protein
MIDQWRMNTFTHDMTSDANYTLTDEENNYGKIIITDTSVFLTISRNIIVSDEQKDFIAENNTLQTLTFKTSGGTGIAVAAGAKVWLMCDGTDVIEAVDVTGLDISTTIQAQAGTDDTKAMSPLKVHEAMLGSDSQQSWQNVTGSRSTATNYTNNTGRPIAVGVKITGTDGTTTLSVDGINISAGFHSSLSEAGVEGIVPNGSVYRVDNSGGLTLTFWSELR